MRITISLEGDFRGEIKASSSSSSIKMWHCELVKSLETKKTRSGDGKQQESQRLNIPLTNAGRLVGEAVTTMLSRGYGFQCIELN